MAENLVRKLGIKTGHKLLILNAPDGYTTMLGELPDGATLATDPASASGAYDFVQVFVRNKADADQYAAQAMAALKPDGILYFAYPKLSSKTKTDINRDSGWDAMLQAGWETVRAVSIDNTWSGLRFRPSGQVKHK